MPTYKEIQKQVVNMNHRKPKSCWIAHVKEMNGLPLRQAHNRISGAERRHPCPDKDRPIIETVMRELGMLKTKK